MDHDHSLEKMLRTARVRAPGEQLDARMESLFAAVECPHRRRLWIWPLAVAAGLLIVTLPVIRVFLATRVPPVATRLPAASNPNEIAQLRIERDESEVIDDGIIAVSDNTPFQQIRRQTVRDIWFIDPQTHARLLVRVPTEQVLVQKVEAF